MGQGVSPLGSVEGNLDWVSIRSAEQLLRGQSPSAPCKGKFHFARNGITCYTILQWSFVMVYSV